MKHYRQFLKEMPAKTIVFAFGRFSPPTTGHGLLVQVVKKIAASNKADYVIYASRTQDKKKNPLSVDKKVHYLDLMFPHTNFKAANDKERTFIEAAKALNVKYKNIIMVAGSDRVPEYERLLNTYNGKDFHFDSIQVISAGERDPDSDDVSGMSASKMRSLAADGDYQSFKKGLPSNIRDMDGKRLMNDVRLGMGMDIIKEQIKLDVDELREKYYNKEIFNIGDIVESNNEPFEILDRGSNYIVVVNSNGETSRKWIQDVVMSEQQIFAGTQFEDPKDELNPLEITFKGYTTKNLHNAPGAAEAFRKTIRNVGTFDPVSVLNALKATDEYLKMTPADIMKGGKENQADLLKWSNAHLKAKQALDRQGEFVFHAEYWHLYKDMLDKAVYAVRVITSDNPISDLEESTMDPNKDKLKVAKMIASILGADPEHCNCPDTLVNNGLRKAKSLNKDSLKIVAKMLKLADEVGIKYDNKIIKATSQLTTEQVEMAMERAERYGRKYPNAIDTAWVMNEGKAPSIVMDKSKVGQVASLRPDDEKKLNALNKMGKGDTMEGLDPKYKKEIENYANTGHTSGIEEKPGVNKSEVTHVGASLTTDGNDTMARMKAKKVMGEELQIDEDFDLTDEEMDKLVDTISEEEIFEAYDDDEFIIIDEEGNQVYVQTPVSEEALMEVLSKMERIKAKLRMAKNQSKLETKREIALKQHSDSKKINKRARHLAINLMKKKLLKGRDPEHLSTSEKERIDRVIEKRKVAIGRLAMKLTSKVRQTEKERLTHKKD